MTVATTIISQLGGNRFIAMTGAKNLLAGVNSVQGKIGRNPKGISHFRVELLPSDTYKMTFLKVRGGAVKITGEISGLYADMLQRVFTSETGLLTSL